MFSKELTAATVTNKYQIQLKRSICCRKNPNAATVGALWKIACKGQCRCLLVNIANFLFLTSNSYFEKHLWTAASEISTAVTNLPKGDRDNFWILFSFYKAFTILNFTMTECFFSLKHAIFIIKSCFTALCLQYTSSELLSFLHHWDYCWKCEFNTDVKIKRKIITTMTENN